MKEIRQKKSTPGTFHVSVNESPREFFTKDVEVALALREAMTKRQPVVIDYEDSGEIVEFRIVALNPDDTRATTFRSETGRNSAADGAGEGPTDSCSLPGTG